MPVSAATTAPARAPTLVYVHPSGKHQLRQYAVAWSKPLKNGGRQARPSRTVARRADETAPVSASSCISVHLSYDAMAIA